MHNTDSNTDKSFTAAESNSFSSSMAQKIFRDILCKYFYFIMNMYVVCTQKNYLKEAILMNTLNIPLFYKRSKVNH